MCVCGERGGGPEPGREAVEGPAVEGEPQRRDEPPADDGEPDITGGAETSTCGFAIPSVR